MSRHLQPALLWRLSPTRTRLALGSYVATYPLLLMTLTCVGFALRLGLLSAFPLREDEAIYGYWARAAVSDPFFLQVWPDKPPLFIWTLTGAFALLGPAAESARLVSIFASTLTIPLVAAGARRLWQSRMAALLAALIITFSPFAVSFAPTAYTDSLLVLFGTGAMVMALRGRALAVGLLLGAACMTKQQGLFYAPLVIALLVFRSSEFCHPVGVSLPSPPERPLRGDKAKYRNYAKVVWTLFGVALIILPILWWDSQRWAVAPSPWEMAQRTYAPLTWLSLQQWPSRIEAWSNLLWYLGGSWAVWLLLGVALLGVTLLIASTAQYRPRLALIWALLVGWGLAFTLSHIVTSVQVWDRYLLPLAPWLALMASGPLVLIFQTRLPAWMRGVFVILLILGMAELVYPGVDAARGQLPIGGDHGDYAGLTEAIAWVQDQCGVPQTVPSPNWGGLGRGSCPAILYHQVLGWHFRFYLYNDLQPQGDNPPRFDLRWFPSAAYLADNAAKSPYPPKYLIVPDWATPRDLAMHLAMRGLALEPRMAMGRFAVLEITQPPRPLCDWCKSYLRRPSPFAPIMPSTPQMSLPSTL